MAVKRRLIPSFYQDSVALMRLAHRIRASAGVLEAAALMGTPANHAILAQAGLGGEELAGAGPNDLILSVCAETEATAEAALDEAQEMLARGSSGPATDGHFSPRDMPTAIGMMPGANLALISVPGDFAGRESMRALKNSLHVFLFSDNVSLDDEIALKDEALARGLLMMGPDCGTAYIGGVGLGFSNRVRAGRVGLVAASGTGLQAVACGLNALGEGVSHGIGVGGRDLSAEVGGRMTKFALDVLARDAATEAIVVISKPPAREVLPALEAALERTGKPCVACCLGAEREGEGPPHWVGTLEDAALAAVAGLEAGPWQAQTFEDPAAVAGRAGRLGDVKGGGIWGLYTGGTLAHEAHLILERHLGDVGFNEEPRGSAHTILDLGDDAFTVGRPHPMLDPALRADYIRRAGDVDGPGVVLIDLILGQGSHDDPAAPVAAAAREAAARAGSAGRGLVCVASVVGTEEDPQGLADQVARLEEAGVEVFPSNAQAARFAALLVRPALADVLLEGAA